METLISIRVDEIHGFLETQDGAVFATNFFSRIPIHTTKLTEDRSIVIKVTVIGIEMAPFGFDLQELIALLGFARQIAYCIISR